MGDANEEVELGIAGVDEDIQVLGGRVRQGMTLSLSVTWIERAWIFGLGVLIARGLTEKDYAAFGAALAFVGVLITADDLGMLAAVINHHAPVRQVAPSAVTVALTSGAVLYAGYWFAAPAIATAFGLPGATQVFRVVGLGMLADAAGIVPNAVILRELRQKRRSMVVLARLGVRTAVTVAVLLTVEGALGVAWAFALGEIAALVVAWAASPFRPMPRFDWPVVRSLLKIGVPVSVGAVFAMATFNVDNLIVGNVLGATQLAYYLVAFNAASWLVNIVGGAVTQVGGPALAEYKRLRQPLGELVSRSTVWLLEVALPCSALLAALADPLIRFLYGDRYAPAIDVLRIIAALGVGRLLVNLGRDGLVADGFARTYAVIQIVWAAMVAIGVYVGTRVDGLSGAAAAQVVVASIIAVVTYVILDHKLGIGASFLRLVVRPLIGAIAGGAVAWLASDATQSVGVPLLQLVVGGVAGGLVCLGVGFSRERRAALLDPLRRRWEKSRSARNRRGMSDEAGMDHATREG
jgi:O-antigen/teichoic acid export membrane protein